MVKMSKGHVVVFFLLFISRSCYCLRGNSYCLNLPKGSCCGKRLSKPDDTEDGKQKGNLNMSIYKILSYCLC